MPLSQNLSKFTTASPVLASYNYTDIEEGSGVVVYHGFADDNTGATNYGLTKSNIYSLPVSTSKTTSSGTVTEDIDFDLTINNPKTLHGDVIANIPMTAVSNQDQGCRTSVVLTVYHYDGTTETSLGTKTSNYITNNGANVLKDGIACLKIPVDNVIFASGDILRMNVVLTVVRIDGTCTGSVRHDPANRPPSSPSATYEASNIIFNVPFKLDL